MSLDDSIDESPVTVARFEWQTEANLARGRLASTGIAALIPEEVMGGLCWHYTKALGGFRLQVSSEDAEDALTILEEHGQQADEPVLSGIEDRADRVLRAAVFGTVILPLQLYAFWLLLSIFFSKERLQYPARWKVIQAAVLNLPFVLISALAVAIGMLRAGS